MDAIEKELDVFEEIGKIEHPVRCISSEGKERKIFDVETGKLLSSVALPQHRPIVFILDGDHGITWEYKVFSFSKKKAIQEVEEMHRFLRELGGPEYFVGLPAPKDYAYTVFYGNEPARAHEVFDPRSVVKKVVTFKPEKYKEMVVWSWEADEGGEGGEGEAPQEKRLRKEYEFKFPSTIKNILALPSEKGNEIAVE